MADPTTSNILLAVPTRGSDVGTWDLPINGDMTALDGILGGNATISLSAATTLALSVPSTGTVSAGAGPNQSQNAVVKFTGTLVGNAVIQLTLPRRYVFDNQCTVGTSYIQIAPASGTGTAIGLPPGEKTEVAYDGTNVDFVGLGRVGSLLDICGISTTQPWMTACTKLPYLPRDGATYSTAAFPALGAMLGSTFGGNGITTFGVPDTRNRFALPVDVSGQGRVTNAVSGIDGTVVGPAGGSQFLQQHSHTATQVAHSHTTNGTTSVTASNQGSGGLFDFTAGARALINITIDLAQPAITVQNTGTGTSQNMPPVVVFGCGFIKT